MLDGRELKIEGCIPTRDAVIDIEIVRKQLPDLVDKLNEFRLLNNVERAVERKKQEELQVVLEHEYGKSTFIEFREILKFSFLTVAFFSESMSELFSVS